MKAYAATASAIWPRAIILVDMNAFFASIEQCDFPELQGQPVCVTNGMTGTCVITCSYEARAFGIRTGMRLKQARRLCPDIIRRPARPERYAAVSSAIMRVLTQLTPDVEVFSVDEAFLDVTACQRLLGGAEQLAWRVKQLVRTVSGVSCSIGLSGDKTTAKWAAKQSKPDGFTVVLAEQAAQTLAPVPVTELCGVNRGIGRFLAERGVERCGQMARLPIGVLGKRFGNIGRRIWLMAQGLDPEPVTTHVPPPKSIGHGKVMPPDTHDPVVIRMYLQHMCQKVCRRLRQHQLEAGHFFFGLRTHDQTSGWLAEKKRIMPPLQDGNRLYDEAFVFMDACWSGGGVHQVQITALEPRPAGLQQDMFCVNDYRRDALNQTMDVINDRYGEFALSPAALINRSEMPNVIAPAWKPFGHRETICSAGEHGSRKRCTNLVGD